MKTLDLTISPQQMEEWISEMTKMGVDRKIAKGLIKGFVASSREEMFEQMPRWIEFCCAVIRSDMALIRISVGTAYAQYDTKMGQFQIHGKENFN